MILEIPREQIDTVMQSHSDETSEIIRNKVLQARDIQQSRYKDTSISTNAQLGAKDIAHYIYLEPEAETFLKESAKRLILSTRVVHRIIKLARTIADLENTDSI
jgi:magnesium chelatase family protein